MDKRPGIIFMPHGNLQYSQLPPGERGWVAEVSYGRIFDLVLKLGVKIAFEASGETLAIIAAERPEVLAKLKAGIKAGLIEPVGSPQVHIMLANIDPEIGLHSLMDGLDTWERLTGARPAAGWNPECSWAWFIPDIFRAAGYETLIADADSYLLAAVPGLREAAGLAFDVRGHSNKNALFRMEEQIAGKPEILEHLFRPHRLANGLKIILRSDLLCNILLWYLMGATEGNRTEPIRAGEVEALLARWRDRIPGGNGFVMPYAEDAEYVGTTAYFFVKQFGLARFFEPAPESVGRFAEILRLAKDLGFAFLTPSEAVSQYEALPGEGFERIENGCAWHGGTAKAWENTIHARLLDPVCRSILAGLRAVAGRLKIGDLRAEDDFLAVLRKITAACVSDARWPPTPVSPGRFNVEEALRALEEANAGIEDLMRRRGIAAERGLYSPALMATQIAAVRDELMALPYFGEKVADR